MIASFITYTTDTEPYRSMAEQLCHSIHDTHAGLCHIIKLNPNGSNLFAEALGRGYELMSDFIDEGPVILIDADCIIKKPIYDLFKEDFSVAAVYRGKHSNAMGSQNFLSTIACFHHCNPNRSRAIWLRWADLTMRFAMEAPQVKHETVGPHNVDLQKAGWLANWFCDQSALNEILSTTPDVKELSRDLYAVKPGTEGAYIWHYKGRGKLQ